MKSYADIKAAIARLEKERVEAAAAWETLPPEHQLYSLTHLEELYNGKIRVLYWVLEERKRL